MINEFESRITVEIVTTDIPPPTYGIVLAAGNGRRMAAYIKENFGVDHPKQYVALTGIRSLIRETLDRVETLIPRENILVVVDPSHEQAILEQLGDRPEESLIYQPLNRETAPGVLLPLSYIYKLDPESIVVIFPSDHYIREEDHFMEYIIFARRLAYRMPDKVILLGIEPDAPEAEYGWIQPGEQIFEKNGMEISRVSRFVEKPDPDSAQLFYEQGYLWNSLVVVCRCSTLWNLMRRALPDIHPRFENILAAIGTPDEESVILNEYGTMLSANLSHDVLERFPSRLLVAHVKNILWNDLGNGKRVTELIRKISK